MTVKLHDGNGSETILRLSMQTIVGISVTIVLFILGGIIAWVNGISCQMNANTAEIAVLKQVDTSTKENLNNVTIAIKEMNGKLDAIQENQIRYMRKNGK